VDLDGTRTLHGPVAIADCGLGNADCKKVSENSPTLGELNRGLNQQSAISNRQSNGGVLFSSWPAGAFVPEVDPASQTRRPGNNVPPDADDLARQREVEARPGFKISVSREGWYRLTQQQLIEAGLDPNVDATHLQLYLNGRVVPIKRAGQTSTFDKSDYIEFYGQGSDSPTDPAQTYYLTVADTAGSRVREGLPGSLGPPSGPASFAYTIERKERMIYFAGLLNGDVENFFGQIISSGQTSSSLPVSHPEIQTPAQLEIALQGVTSQSHQVQVSFNGEKIGLMDFSNTDHPVQTFDIPGQNLIEGDNLVTLTAVGAGSDVSLVDVMRLTYGHIHVADNNRLELLVNDAETRRFSGFDNENIRVIDVKSPTAATEITSAARVNAEPDGSFSVDVQVTGATNLKTHKLLVFADSAAVTPDAVKLNEASSWWSETDGADYLIITTHDLLGNVEPLAQLRRNQGLVVKVVDVEDLFDEYSYGLHSPQALKDFIQTTQTTWTLKPHFLLLAGDASYDPKNYFGLGNNDLVPTKLVDTVLREVASDDWLADFNADGVADLAIGRLPVRTTGQADTMVNKIISYENMTPDPNRAAMLVADHTFEAASSSVQSLLPSGMPVQVINRNDSDDASIHNQIMSALNQGPQVANYFGHGSTGVWTSALLLSNDDAPLFTNTNRLTVFTMMTCYNGFFQDAVNDSLAESLLKAPGGAVAVWASTALTEPDGQTTIDQEFYRQIFAAQPATLGDASRAAKLTTSDSDVRRTWTLFGDPAMHLR
jgi:hypothetical protein